MKIIKSNIVVTKHAAKRMQKRSIPSDIVDLLLVHGDWRSARGGCERIFFPKECRSELEHDLGAGFARVERYLDAYLIASDSSIVTVGHDYKYGHRRAGRFATGHSYLAAMGMDDEELSLASRKRASKRHKKPTRH